jgi:hypothetical protein
MDFMVYIQNIKENSKISLHIKDKRKILKLFLRFALYYHSLSGFQF